MTLENEDAFDHEELANEEIMEVVRDTGINKINTPTVLPEYGGEERKWYSLRVISGKEKKDTGTYCQRNRKLRLAKNRF